MTTIPHALSMARRGVFNYFLKRPFCISYEITHSCNARCKHCHLGGPVDEQRAPPQRFGDIAREHKPLVAQLSGGEPLLRKDLEEIIRAIKRPNRAPYIIVCTNGVLLTKEKYLRLKHTGADAFSVSLDYPDERHDEFRCVPGLFRRIEKLIKEIGSENRKAINLACVIQRDNFRDLVKIAELAREWGVKVNFSAYNTLRTNDKSYMIAKEDMGEFQEVIKNLLEFKRRYRNIITSDYVFMKMLEYFENGMIPDCRTGETFFNINPDGTFSPCGLIITDYQTKKELVENFGQNSSCSHCFTSTRANSEKPAWYLIKDSFSSLR
jgi:MoaA/NifB/PqqE/SkfB family radical SAM enzyme